MTADDDLVDRISHAIRESRWRSLAEFEAEERLGVPWAEVRDAAASAEQLELVSRQRRDGRGSFEVIRLGGVRVDAPDRVVETGEEAVARPTVELGPEPTGDHLAVLDTLEDLEADRINFGLYDTFVSVEEIASRRAGGGVGDVQAARGSLERLISHGYVLDLGDDRFRSRISEIVRVVKRVKQRFDPDDADRAPYLVNAVRVEFADRRRLARNRPLDLPLRRLFEAYRGKRPRLDSARRTVAEGVAAALGLEPGDTQITGIQERALQQLGEALLEPRGGGFVITGNTGSGKTEAALFPLILAALQERLNDIVGCKVILVYPRQELAKNQLQRLCRYLAHVNRAWQSRPGHGGAALTAGIVFGQTPFTQDELNEGSANGHRGGWEPEGNGRRLPYFEEEDSSAVLFEATGDGVGRLVARGGFENGGWVLDGFPATRNAVLARPPDFLVITTEMLHRWLSDPAGNDLFGVTRPGEVAPRFYPPRALLMDEIHLYEAAHGAQVGMLIRRLRERLGTAMRTTDDDWTYPVVIGMSATIGNPGRFWSELSGLPSWLLSAITPQDSDFESGEGREYFLFIRPETYSRGRHVGDASLAIQTVMSIAHNMRRRGAHRDDPPKHRSLVFQDSISKVKKLALEFHDAEENLFLARLRFTRPGGDPISSTAFLDGEYWIFEDRDPLQYGENRRAPGQPPARLSTSTEPVHGGRAGGEDLQRDIIFATTALEVGYDDPAIQFILQHHAPRTPASFVQKKGRAGRALDDRPITAVTLSRHSFRDAFYFQNPKLLCDPADYRPPLNVGNFFVQRFQSLAFVFDELARLEGLDFSHFSCRPTEGEVGGRLELVRERLAAHATAVRRAYERVAAPSLRSTYRSPDEVWEWFTSECSDPDIRSAIQRTRNLLRGHPGLPDNLFSTVNLPTVRLSVRPTPMSEWRFHEEDVALFFSEAAPGKVTRRYGWQHNLHWRRPDPKVAIERFRPNREPPGPFRPDLVRQLSGEWGSHWQQLLPRRVREVHGGRLPEGFYRIRFTGLWNFGQLDPAQPKEPQASWRYWARRVPGGVQMRFADEGEALDGPWRRVSPDSSSDSLSFSHVRLSRTEAGEVEPAFRLRLPPVYPGVLDELDGYCGNDADSRAPVQVWEVHYGAEARVVLRPNGPQDDQAGTVGTTVAYTNDADNDAPLLYGHDLATEGLAAPFDRGALQGAVEAVFAAWWDDTHRRSHIQDQFLRHMLKTQSWPAPAVEPPLNVFEIRLATDLLSTMRAETRAAGTDADAFLAQLKDGDAVRALVQQMRAIYWRDSRRVTDEFVDRIVEALTDEDVRSTLAETFARLTTREAVLEYLAATTVHSLKHAVHRLFSTEGYTRDEEVGSTAFLPFTHGHWGDESRFFVFERNAGGNGATRLLQVAAQRPPGYLLNRWWEHSIGCPVAQDEDFVRTAFTRDGARLVAFAQDFLAAAPKDRPSPRPFLTELLPEVVDDDMALGRLAGILTGELKLATDPGLSVAALHDELQRLEDQLASRFQRHPIAEELAGYVATRVEDAPQDWPALAGLQDLYVRYADQLGQSDEPAITALERFLDQVGQLLPRTCVDACPACLAGHCQLGPIDATRHALSRRLLRAVHEVLTADSTLYYRPGATGIEDIEVAAEAGNGWAVLVCDRPIERALAADLRNRFDERGRLADHENFTVRLVLQLRPSP